MSRRTSCRLRDGWPSLDSGDGDRGALRLMVPRVLYETPSAFKAGKPQDYVVGEVNEPIRMSTACGSFREADGFYALSAIVRILGAPPGGSRPKASSNALVTGAVTIKTAVNFEGRRRGVGTPENHPLG